MIILGVDPGTWQTGAGLIETEGPHYRLIHFEVIQLKKGLSLASRLKNIHVSLSEIMLKYQPDVLALESVFFGQDVRALVKIGEARASAMLAASERGLDVIEYPPAKVKQAVTGNGRATKTQMQHMIKQLLGLKDLPPADGADALAVAICHAHCARGEKNVRLS